jgi:hypothetical protein
MIGTISLECLELPCVCGFGQPDARCLHSAEAISGANNNTHMLDASKIVTMIVARRGSGVLVMHVDSLANVSFSPRAPSSSSRTLSTSCPPAARNCETPMACHIYQHMHAQHPPPECDNNRRRARRNNVTCGTTHPRRRWGFQYSRLVGGTSQYAYPTRR